MSLFVFVALNDRTLAFRKECKVLREHIFRKALALTQNQGLRLPSAPPKAKKDTLAVSFLLFVEPHGRRTVFPRQRKYSVLPAQTLRPLSP